MEYVGVTQQKKLVIKSSIGSNKKGEKPTDMRLIPVADLHSKNFDAPGPIFFIFFIM